MGILGSHKKNGEGIRLRRSQRGAVGVRLSGYRIILIDNASDVVANVRE